MPPYVAEMPLAGLRAAELFLLTALRLWLAAHCRADVPDWRQGFAAAGLMEDGAPDFDMALRILVAGVRRVDSRPAVHPRLSADEARLLRLFGVLQRGETGAAVGILQAWLPCKPLRWLMRYARSVVGVMAAQRLISPDRMPVDLPHFALRSTSGAFLNRGSILLHWRIVSALKLPAIVRKGILNFPKSPSVDSKIIFIPTAQTATVIANGHRRVKCDGRTATGHAARVPRRAHLDFGGHDRHPKHSAA